jgi:hypothetical protein
LESASLIELCCSVYILDALTDTISTTANPMPVYYRYMAVVHISEMEAARDLAGFMTRAIAGDEVIIDNGVSTVTLVPSPVPSRRSISACIMLAKSHEKESSEAPILDSDFAVDVEEIIRNRKPWNPPAWD